MLDDANRDLLYTLAEGTAAAVGDAFFPALVQHIAIALRVKFAFVAEFADDASQVRTLAFWKHDDWSENIQYALAGTPCEHVVAGRQFHQADGVFDAFPEDRMLIDLQVRSYLGVPLVHPETNVHLGHLAVMDTEPLFEAPRSLQIFRIFAARATAELMRLRAEAALEDSKDRYRALASLAEPGAAVVGKSDAFCEVLRQVSLVAPTDSTVLIRGETGTGKEVIARAIHEQSRRNDQAFIGVNCAALPQTLVESELFGHERGAFTGATERRTGRFELADGGTIFLDEIGDMPASAQAKLLRVLQEGVFERVGGTKTLSVDVRVLAATNRDLGRLMSEGEFREDLYYRLNVFPIMLPPLKERSEDIPELVSFFLGRLTKKIGRTIRDVSEPMMGQLLAYDWPGNVRELQNVLERAVILSSGPTLELSPGALPQPTGRPRSELSAGSELLSLDEAQRRHIQAALERTGGVVEGAQGAARILGVNASTLRGRMRKLGIDIKKN